MLNLPPQLKRTYIQSNDPNGAFVQTLQRLLIANHITVTPYAADATAVLRLTDMTTSNQLTFLSGAAEAGQYTLSGSVVFTVIDAKTGQTLIPATTVTNSRQFSSNATQALSAQSKINELSAVVQNEMAQSIVNQLAQIPEVTAS